MKSNTVTRAWMLAATLATASMALVFSSPVLQEQLDGPKLKALIEGLGHEIKVLDSEIGKEKFEFKVTRDELDIYIAAEISPSKNYVWLTVFLGPAPKDSEPAAKFREMLKANSRIQPTQFYITASDRLMLGFAMENRSLTAQVFKRTIDKLAGDVVSTEDLWSED
jgi:hypothetical protein